MRFDIALSILAITAALCSGCGTAAYYGQNLAPVVPANGILFANISGPLTTNYRASPLGGKKGEASTFYARDPILTGMDVSWDDASIEAAAKNGGITNVQYADYHILQILGVFGKFTVTVYGE